MIRAAVLAGGYSSRFGSDKALAPLGKNSFLGATIRLLRGLNLEPVLLAPKARGYGKLFSCEVVEDDHPGEGPLAALATFWKKKPQDTTLILTCDMPALTADALLRLLLAHDPDSAVTVYECEGRIQPFPGIYQSKLSLDARRRAGKGSRSMMGFLEAVSRKKIIPWSGPPAVLANVNRTGDLPAAV